MWTKVQSPSGNGHYARLARADLFRWNERAQLCVSRRRSGVQGLEGNRHELWSDKFGGGAMQYGANGSNGAGNGTLLRNEDSHVQEVVKTAHEELRQLMRQRAEIMKRIGTLKQTIAGLANLFGDAILGEDLWEW